METSLSYLVDNLAEGIHKIDNKNNNNKNKKCETCRIVYIDCESCLEYTDVMEVLI